MPRRQPRWPSIGLDSCSMAARWRDRRRRRCRRPRRPRRSRPSVCGRNSCSGGSSSRIVTGRPVMMRKISTKSSRCIGSSLASAARRPALVVGQDHLAHRDDAVGRRRTCARCGRGRCPRRRSARAVRASVGRVGVGAHLQRADRVGPAHQRREIAGQLAAGSSAPRPASPRRCEPSMVMMSPSPAP